MVIAALLAAACGSTSVTQVAGPDDVRCQTTLGAQPTAVGADGGTVTISVATTRDCSWTASSEVSWIRLSTASGQGEATFTANVEANPQIASRAANVTVNAQRVRIAQEARPCTFELSPAAASFDGAGGTGRVTVTTISGCSWRASSAVAWIQIAPDTRTGSGAIDFQVLANDGAARNAVITIADRAFTVSQGAAPAPGPAPPAPVPGPAPAPDCTPTLTPATVDVAASPSTQSIQLSIGAACTWSAVSNTAWLTVVSAASGTGNAAISIAVAQNTGAARTGTVTIAGQQVTVRQTALTCTFALSPTSQSVAASGGTGRFTVTTQAACAWTASAGVAWITLTSSAGNGSGDVTFNVQPSTLATPRSGTITVGGQTFTVNQAAAPCSYSLSPASVSVAADGARGRFTVTTASNCSWSAVPGASWVNVSNNNGTGTGDVNYSVDANSTTAARSTSIAIGGQLFAITQSGIACTYSLSPTSLNIAAGGGDGRFTLTTQAGCTWTAASGAAWVTVGTPSGTGSGDVVYTVLANPDTAPRSTTVVAGGQTHTVNQAAAPCTYSIDPTSGSFAAVGGPGQFRVTTQAGCTWTATTTADWITLTSPSGSGTGDVTYSVQVNSTGVDRTATVVVGGQTYTVSETAQ